MKNYIKILTKIGLVLVLPIIANAQSIPFNINENATVPVNTTQVPVTLSNLSTTSDLDFSISYDATETNDIPVSLYVELSTLASSSFHTITPNMVSITKSTTEVGVINIRIAADTADNEDDVNPTQIVEIAFTIRDDIIKSASSSRTTPPNFFVLSPRLASGTNEIQAEKTLKVFPNPTNSVLHIQNNEIINTQIINTAGQVVVNQNTNDTQINVQHLPQGIYILRTTTANEIYQQRISIKH